MTALHSLLAVYGAIDESVVQAKDPEWSALVERYLPGTTGENQRGWFADIQRLVGRLAVDPAGAGFKPLADALSELNAEAGQMRPPQDTGKKPRRGPAPKADDSTPPAGDAPPTPAPLTIGHIGQALYVTAVVRKLAPHAPATSVDFTPIAEDSVNLDDIFGLAGELPLQAGPTSPSRIQQLKELLESDAFTGLDAWPNLMQTAVAAEIALVTKEVAVVPPFCVVGTSRSAVTDTGTATATAAVTLIDDHYCAVLTTDSWRNTPGLTVDKVKRIVDPRNWDKLCAFFCQMDPLPPDSDGASQVLEHVSTNKDVYRMKTALKNWRRDYEGGGIVNYELADNREGTGDSQLVLVDSGFIHISKNVKDDGTENGVRIKTSKMVAIQGASVTATAIFVPLMGWAAIGDSMLFDNATRPEGELGTLETWTTSPEAPAGGPAGAIPADELPPELPPDSRGLLVAEAIRMLAKSIDQTSTTTAALVDKWYSGNLTLPDIVRHSTELGGRLASEPWRFLAELSNQIGTAPPQGPRQGTNGGGSP
jgi:hypothetical protein